MPSLSSRQLITFACIAVAVVAAIAHAHQQNQQPPQPAPQPDPQPAPALGADAEADVLPRLHLRVTLDPAAQRLAVDATIVLAPSIAETYRRQTADADADADANGMGEWWVPFWLQPELRIEQVGWRIGSEIGLAVVRPANDGAAADAGARIVVATGKPPQNGESCVMTVRYAGAIHDPIERSGSLTGDSGDSTSGIVSEKGVYLAGGGGWYPMVAGQKLCRFDVDADVPLPMRVVTQGRLPQGALGGHRREIDGREHTRWQSEWPTPGLSLVAGPYVFHSRQSRSGIEVVSAFFERDAHLGPMFVANAIAVIDTYEQILGKFPFSSFHIVENFFSTGYGMPGFTLLGDRLVAMGPMAMLPGMLDHEIVHSWWGCSVYTDHARGNWCEAFTAYFTNYYAHELRDHRELRSPTGDPRSAAAREIRDMTLSFNVLVPHGRGVPLRAFSWRATPILGAVGYTKGAMFLHYLRALVGDDLFFRTMRELAQKFCGRFMAWADVEAAFAAVAVAAAPAADAPRWPMGAIFSEWLDRADIPDLELVDVRFDRSTKQIVGTIRQTTETPYTLVGLQIAVEYKPKSGARGAHDAIIKHEIRPVDLTTGETAFAVPLADADDGVDADGSATATVSLRLQNGYAIFRRLQPAEQSACVGRLVASDGVTVIVPPGEAGTAFASIAADLAAEGMAVVSGDAVTPEILARGATLILGTPATNPVFARLMGRELAGGKLAVRDDGEIVDMAADEPLPRPTRDLLMAFANPFAPAHPMVIYAPYSPVGIGRTRMIFRYRWDSLIVFENGRPTRRDAFSAPADRCRVTVVLTD